MKNRNNPVMEIGPADIARLARWEIIRNIPGNTETISATDERMFDHLLKNCRIKVVPLNAAPPAPINYLSVFTAGREYNSMVELRQFLATLRAEEGWTLAEGKYEVWAMVDGVHVVDTKAKADADNKRFKVASIEYVSGVRIKS